MKNNQSINKPTNQLTSQPSNRTQTGFTLIEVMVALAIFAMLSVVGWQIFDNLNRSKNRAKVHADALSDLQFAYLQLQNDINQITAWQTLPLAKPLTTENTGDTGNQGGNLDNNANKKPTTKITSHYEKLQFFELSSTQVAFIRYADPDPRYQSSPTLVKVVYTLEGDVLVRHQSAVSTNGQGLSSQNTGSGIISDTATSSALLTDVKGLQLQAFIPETVGSFSSESVDDKENGEKIEKEPLLLPKGVAFSFNYKEEPIHWVFALPKQAPALLSNYQVFEKSDKQSNKPKNAPKVDEDILGDLPF